MDRSLVIQLESQILLIFLSMPSPCEYAFFLFVEVGFGGHRLYHFYRFRFIILIWLWCLLLWHQRLMLLKLHLVEDFWLKVLMKQHWSSFQGSSYLNLTFVGWSRLYCWKSRIVFLFLFICKCMIAFLPQIDTLNLYI